MPGESQASVPYHSLPTLRTIHCQISVAKSRVYLPPGAAGFPWHVMSRGILRRDGPAKRLSSIRGRGPESARAQRGRNRSFLCVFGANGALSSSASRWCRTKYNVPFNPKKGLKFQYFPVLSRREGILECLLFFSASFSKVAVSIFLEDYAIMAAICQGQNRNGVALYFRGSA